MDVSGISSSQGTSQLAGVPSGRHHHQLRAKIESAVADKLGMSVDDLTSQLAAGKSLTDVATAHGVSKDDLVSTIASTLQANGPGDLTQLATQLADRVENHQRAGGTPELRATSSAITPADLARQLAQTRQTSGGSDPDHDGDVHPAANYSVTL